MHEAVEMSATHLDHHVDVINVKASCSDVGANQYMRTPWLPELLERSFPCSLL